MIKALIRTAFWSAAAYGVYTVAHKYYGSQIDDALDSVKSKAKDFTNDVTKDLSHKAQSITGSLDKNVKRAV